MILSASRRTDIPNYYSEWLARRFRAGFLCVRNPMNFRQVSRITLNPNVIDCIVFWTKNPAPMLPYLDEYRRYMYYFQFTLTGYGKDIEPGLPDKRRILIPAFCELADRIGRDRVIWRYDPIFLSDHYTLDYHVKAFTRIAEALAGRTRRVVISFLDDYEKTKRNMKGINIQGLTKEKMRRLAHSFAVIAGRYGMEIQTCAEKIDLSEYGITHGACIDREYIEHLLGCRLRAGKDHGQRPECRCMESVEIGSYHTCRNGCRYCYANFSDGRVQARIRDFDVDSPILCGKMEPEDRITERKMKTLRENQMTLEDYFS
ncbi:DUF1848 domain-containing protein [[Ruminococcus] torques]|uniref:DUF1848 domain-containing protein n=1 Tax=[Ruminococcus] torques TaxID=33039 RepID=UPI001F99230E|nr:DUF1848 domain-containing protein [[Ruminococcus] torques]MBS5399927.1 DUF1848 domain-containing protein [Lachnospiraceae bacterium]MDM8237225.1 DUF1848 domain-containing protein [[Ruminococcus] torques]HJC79485.1 DUF1848 domain-containing protein [Candidatus Mediterraneibacter excrementipullorum]